MARYRAESYDTFNELAQRAIGYPPLERDELTIVFLRIEELISYGISVLLETTTFVEDNLCYLMAEIACGRIKSRKVYRGKRDKRRVQVGEDVEVGSTNSRIFGLGFDLFKLSKTEREEAVPLIRKVLRSMRLSTSVFENILVSFCREAADYCRLRDDLAAMTLKARNVRSSRRKLLIDDMRMIGNLIDDLQVIEMSVGCVRPNELYGTYRIVKDLLDKIRRQQERILKAYLRLVPGPARSVAKNELEALDLFQSGSLGLAHAISRYNVRKGASFPSFARSWIQQKILGAVKRSSPMIRLPNSVWEAWQKIRAAERSLQASATTRETYTDYDVGELTGMSVRSIERFREKVHLAKVVPIAAVAPDDDHEWDFLAAGTDGQDNVDLIEMRSVIAAILGHVSPEDRRLVCLKYGYVEGVLNERIDPNHALREILRQLACSAILHRDMASAAEILDSAQAPGPLPA